MRSLEELSSTVPNESVVIIYFSGHGYQLKDEFDQGLIPGGLKKEMVSWKIFNNIHTTFLRRSLHDPGVRYVKKKNTYFKFIIRKKNHVPHDVG